MVEWPRSEITLLQFETNLKSASSLRYRTPLPPSPELTASEGELPQN